MKRNGFTLVEVLVILAILAALAAILVPTVANQVRKSDVSRVVGDLNNLRTGVEAFLVNVHRYPGDIDDLTAPIVAGGTDTDINAVNYSTGIAAQWEGPYIDRVLVPGDSMETGFGAYIFDAFVIDSANSVGFLTVEIYPMATPEFNDVDEAIDGGDGATLGRLRVEIGDTIRFLALPIN